MTDRRRTFGPVLLLGLGAGALAAVAATRPWVVDAGADGTGEPIPGLSVADPVAAAGEVPVALALSLVVLATWGVVLVTRGAVRRMVALLGLLAAAGLTASVLVALLTLDDRVSDAILERSQRTDVPATEWSPWLWAAIVASLLILATTALAVAWSPQWPEMGRRYDAPGADRSEPSTPASTDASSLDLWKSLDEGHDPTV